MKLWLPLGYFFLALAALGVVLPLLPTTPFVLLAAGCFARCSPRLHQRLLNSRWFGPLIKDWEHNRCIKLKTKLYALSMTAIVGSSSILYFTPTGWRQIIGLGLLACGCVVILRLPTCPATDEEQTHFSNDM